MLSSPEIDKLATALVEVQKEMEVAPKESDNPFFKSKYADLATIWKTAQKVLPKNGLAVIQTMEPSDGSTVNVTTRLVHKSGQWTEGTITMDPKKNDPQGIGSCVTYARRYSLSAIVGMVTDEDDDGNHASGNTSPPASQHTANTQPTHDKPSEKQVKYMHVLSKQKGVTPDLAKAQLKKQFNKNSSKELTKSEVQQFITWLNNLQDEVETGTDG